MRVLVTGAAGRIGRVVTVGLIDRGHQVVGLDRVPEPEGFDGPWHSVDCADPDAVAAVFAESAIDAVIHLAGISTESSLRDALTSHVVSPAPCSRRWCGTTYPHRLRLQQPRCRSRAAVGPARHDVRGRPDTFYGVGKVAAEALLQLFVDRHGIDVVSTRIGTFAQRPTSRRQLGSWLSHDDGVRMFHAALTAPSPGSPSSTGPPRTPAAGGTSHPAARSTTNPRTTPSSTPPRSRPRPRRRPTAPRRPTSAAPSRPAEERAGLRLTGS